MSEPTKTDDAEMIRIVDAILDGLDRVDGITDTERFTLLCVASGLAAVRAATSGAPASALLDAARDAQRLTNLAAASTEAPTTPPN